MIIIREKIAGLIYILLGILLIVTPMFSSELLSVCIGLSLVCFGFVAISRGIVFSSEFTNSFSILYILIGIISLIFGILFIFSINALTFLTALQFYIVAIIMMVYGLVGLFGGKNKFYSIIILILGILTFFLAAFLASQPILIAVLVGVALMVEGVFALILGKSMKLIESSEG